MLIFRYILWEISFPRKRMWQWPTKNGKVKTIYKYGWPEHD